MVVGAYQALYINGAIQVAAQERECSRVVAQTPGAKEWATDAFLKTVGWHRTGKDFGTPDANDANDAARHLLKYLADSRQIPNDMLTKLIDLELN